MHFWKTLPSHLKGPSGILKNSSPTGMNIMWVIVFATVITKGKKEWRCKVVWCYAGCSTGPSEVTAVGKHMTHSLQHASKVNWVIVFLSPYLSPSLSRLCPAIVSCDWECFNDRNLVLLNSAAWSDADAKTFLELVVFPSGSPAPPLSPLLCSCIFSIFTSLHSFSFLPPPERWLSERESCVSASRCALNASCLCVMCPVIHPGLCYLVYTLTLFSLLNNPLSSTTPKCHSLHIKATTHPLSLPHPVSHIPLACHVSICL